MIIRNFYDPNLAQASYLIGCSASGEAIVIDPNRNILPYLETAESLGLRIVAATETHIHADFLSGTRELSAATGATLYLSGAGGPDWQYADAKNPRVSLLQNGDRIHIGNVSLQAMHTPGHTPEHLAFLLTDHPVSDVPHSLFSGDLLFVGDVGRPDLLERAVKVAGTMESSARDLNRSLKKLWNLPDSLLVWPGHGAGSSCGKSLGGSPATTLGYERLTNWALRAADEDRFVDEILSGQPSPPTYFKEMKRMNQAGPALRPEASNLPRLFEPVGQLIDLRPAAEIRAGIYDEAIAIPYGKSFIAWAGWVIDYNEPITFLADNQELAELAARDLAAIGLDDVAGWLPPSGLYQNRFAAIPGITGHEILPTDLVLDVREAKEHNLAKIAGSVNIPYGQLAARLDELPRHCRIAVHCAAGSRSLIACSILRKAGFPNVVELPDGFLAIQTEVPQLVG